MRVAQHALGLLRRLQTPDRQRSPRIDFMRNDYNCLVENPVTDAEIELFEVQWRMPYVALNEINKLSILRALKSGRNLSMSFRSCTNILFTEYD